jgi:hypothetical protein
MSLDMTPERLSALAEQLEMTARNHDRSAKLYAADGNADLEMAAGGRANAARDAHTLAAALRVASWLATTGNYVREVQIGPRCAPTYSALSGGIEVGDGTTALAAVLDAVGVKP